MASRRLDSPRGERAELAEEVERYAAFVLANLLWAVVAIPLVTLPAATAGLFAVMMARARGVPADLLATFFGAARRCWLKASLLMGLNLLGGGLVAVNLSIFPLMDLSADPLAFVARSVTLFAALALLLVNLYAWPLLVLLEDLSVKALLENAVRLVFAHGLWSLLVLFVVAAIIAFSLLLPRGVFALATASACAWVMSRGAWRVIRGHLGGEMVDTGNDGAPRPDAL